MREWIMANGVFKENARKLARNIARTRQYLENGFTPADISVIMNQPLVSVQEWVDIIKKADENKAKHEANK